jgi:nicotinamide riboside transporter PnuC
MYLVCSVRLINMRILCNIVTHFGVEEFLKWSKVTDCLMVFSQLYNSTRCREKWFLVGVIKCVKIYKNIALDKSDTVGTSMPVLECDPSDLTSLQVHHIIIT